MGLRQNIIVYCAGQQHHPLVCALPFEANTLTHTVLCYVCSKVCTWQGVSRKSEKKAGKCFQYCMRVSITLFRILSSPDYKAEKIKGIPPTSKKSRQFKKRKKNNTRA